MSEIETNIKYLLLKVRTECFSNHCPRALTDTLFEIPFLSQVEIGT